MTNADKADATAELDPDRLYQGYETWKRWTDPFKYSADDAAYYTGECRGAKINDADVLEIGFGAGGFLTWVQERGGRVAGTEINEASLEAARTFGLETLTAQFEHVALEHKDRFDTIVAFDVFEHFSLDDIITRLRAAETMLQPGGVLILRFPNAQSPFGLAPQNGDPTHKSALSKSVFEQLIQTTNLKIIRYGPAFRITGGGIITGLVRRLRYLTRNTIAGLLNFVYAQKIPWDPVVVLVLRNSE